MKRHHVSYLAGGVLLLAALIPPFDNWSAVLLAAAVLNFGIGVAVSPR